MESSQFQTSTLKIKHIENFHEGIPPRFDCTKCNKSFATENEQFLSCLNMVELTNIDREVKI